MKSAKGAERKTFCAPCAGSSAKIAVHFTGGCAAEAAGVAAAEGFCGGAGAGL
jgi:hypothetical protein